MADNEETETTEKKAAKGPGLMTLIKAVAFVSVIVLLQIAAASMIIPSAEETATIATELAAANLEEEGGTDTSKDAEGEAENPLLATGDMSEVSLGSFHVLSQNLKTGSRTNVDFELFATVLADEENTFFNLFEANEHRIREQVQVTVRGADMTDFTDPTLGLIKRRILEKVNRALGKPLLHEAIFSKFSFEER